MAFGPTVAGGSDLATASRNSFLSFTAEDRAVDCGEEPVLLF